MNGYGYGYEYNTGFDTSMDTSVFAALGAFLAVYIIIILAICAVILVSMWKVYKKAGKPGWASIVPVYNTYVLFEIVGMPGWYAFLMFIPIFGSIVVAVMQIIAYVKLAKCFGKSGGFAVGLVLVPFIFFPMLAFDKSTYTLVTE